jgi:hypothetical protein
VTFQELSKAFKTKIGRDFYWTEQVVKLAAKDPKMRGLLEKYVQTDGPASDLIIAMGKRHAEYDREHGK